MQLKERGVRVVYHAGGTRSTIDADYCLNCIPMHLMSGIENNFPADYAAGLSATELCRKHGISDATFYKWRSRYGGMEISDARRLKALEDENRKLKKLLAETMLDASTLKEMLGKNF